MVFNFSLIIIAILKIESDKMNAIEVKNLNKEFKTRVKEKI